MHYPTLITELLAPAGPHFFEKFPYALPSIAAAGFFLIGIIIGAFFLNETLPSRRSRKDVGLKIGERMVSGTSAALRRVTSYFYREREPETEPLIKAYGTPKPASTLSNGSSDTYAETADETQKPMPTWRDVLEKQSCLNLAAYGLLCMHSLSYDQILPVFMHHPIQSPNSTGVQLPFKFSGGFGIGRWHYFRESPFKSQSSTGT